MLAIDRQRAILNLIEAGGSVRTVAVAEALEVTEETIRRDFEKLEKEGLLARAHGGAVKPTAEGERRDLPFGERYQFQVAEKEAVALAALSEISEGQVLFLDASSTVLHLARNLPDQPLTVISNALQVIWSLRDRRHLTVISTGGRLDVNSASFLGPLAEAALERCHIDIFFFSCRGVDSQRGLSEANDSHAAFKSRVMDAADRSVLLADHTKLGLRSAFYFAAPADLDLAIIDRGATPSALKKLGALRARIRLADGRNAPGQKDGETIRQLS